jgi:hypothetical protein
MTSDVLARAERRADREAARGVAPVVDEYGQRTALLEVFEPGPMVVPSEHALMAQAAAITEAAYEARVARADDLRFVVERARLRRSGDEITRARNRIRRDSFNGDEYLAGLRARSRGR